MKYLWYTYDKVYKHAECQQISDYLKPLHQQSLVDQPGQNKNVDVKSFLTTDKVQEMLQGFFFSVKNANREYFGLELYPEIPETGNLNIYHGDKNSYGYHRDFADFGSMSDIKLTAILNISTETYTGGQFDFFTGEDQHIKELDNTGSILIFPSFLWHRVRPVTQGQRITLSFWFYGPNFR
jgi:PKHD-type hydroxylase